MSRRTTYERDTLKLLAEELAKHGVTGHYLESTANGHVILRFPYRTKICSLVFAPSGDRRARLNTRTDLRKLLVREGCTLPHHQNKS